MAIVQSIILRTNRLQGGYCIVTALTRFGVINFSIRNSLKEKYRFSEEFIVGEFELKDNKKFSNLEFKKGELGTGNNPNSLIRFYMLRLVRDIILETTEGIEIEQFESVYENFQKLLSKESEHSVGIVGACLGFLAYYRNLLGCSFEINKCLRCGSTSNIVGYSISGPGLICANCFDPRESVSIGKEEFSVLRKMFETTGETSVWVSVPKGSELRLLELVLALYQYDFSVRTKICEELSQLLR